MMKTIIISFIMILFSCKSTANQNQNTEIKSESIAKVSNEKNESTIENPIVNKEDKRVVLGVERSKIYEPLLRDKKVGIVTNQTGMVPYTDENNLSNFKHTVDYLLELGVDVKTIFAPEHGFRGKADAAEIVKDGKDVKTGLPIISLYGKNKKPHASQIQDLDVIVFDIQDVGVRFYTYISTLAYVMEAAAENGKKVIVLDRPNPNIHYIDGPVLEKEHKSFLGLFPMPVVYGMTIGEYANMVNGEHWLKNGVQCDLTVVELENYTRNSRYSLPVRPSPNLPNDNAINLYPSLGFFEGTTINAGRGTEFQFQRYGSPYFPKSDFQYKPAPNFGSKNPKFNGKTCNGVDLNEVVRLDYINLNYLIDAYNKTPKNKKFFGETFTIHAGTTNLEKQIKQGLSASEIRDSWKPGLEQFKEIRKQYLIYKD